MSTTTTKFEVTVSYNGVAKQVEVNPKQTVQALLQHALNAFGVKRDRGNLALFDASTGTPLDPNTSVEDAGLSSDSQLVLRPRRVSGGS